MTTITEEKHKLVAILSIILQQLQEKGLLFVKEEDKEEFLNDVAEKLLKLEHVNDAIQDNNVRKTLGLVLINEFVAKFHPELSQVKLADKLEYDFLFDKNLPTPDMQKNLTEHFVLLLTALNQLKPELKLTPQKIAEHAEQFAIASTKDLNSLDDKSLAECEASLKLLAALSNDLLAETLTNLYGHDPRFSGSPIKPVLMFKGNLTGIVDQDGENEASFEPMDIMNRYDGKEDPLGTKNSIRERLDATSAILGSLLEPFYTNVPSLHPHPHE